MLLFSLEGSIMKKNICSFLVSFTQFQLSHSRTSVYTLQSLQNWFNNSEKLHYKSVVVFLITLRSEPSSKQRFRWKIRFGESIWPEGWAGWDILKRKHCCNHGCGDQFGWPRSKFFLNWSVQVGVCSSVSIDWFINLTANCINIHFTPRNPTGWCNGKIEKKIYKPTFFFYYKKMFRSIVMVTGDIFLNIGGRVLWRTLGRWYWSSKISFTGQ